jgi:hypothetical protein
MSLPAIDDHVCANCAKSVLGWLSPKCGRQRVVKEGYCTIWEPKTVGGK